MDPEPLNLESVTADNADFLRSLVSVLPGVIYQARFAADGTARIEYMSEAARELLECEPADVVRDLRVFRNLIHPEDREMFERHVERQRCQSGTWRLEYRVILPSGRVRWIASRAAVLATSDGGTLWRGFLADITDRKRDEQELIAEKERLALAATGGGIGTWDYNPRDGSIRWNDVMYEIHGVDPATYEPTQENNFRFLVPEEHERVEREFRRACESSDHHYAIDVRIVRPDGEERLTRSQAVILRDGNGTPTRVIGIEIDITEEVRRREALAAAKEAAEAAHRAKSEFLATMSHEIRTPMNGILGYTALLRETITDGDQREFIEIIEACGERLLDIINDILDTARIEAGDLAIRTATFDLRSCVRETFDLLRPAAQAKNLVYECTIDDGVPAAMECDRGRIAQVLTNVLGNAIKFTDSGSVKLHVRAEKAGHDWQWEFRIVDTGPGMSPEVTSRIFEPFYQAEASSTRRHGGTGLGLAISHRIAKMLHGSLTVTSRPGVGSQFLFVISAPAADPHVETPWPQTSVSLPPGSLVLVVEDNPVNRRLCELQLKRLGCAAEFATNGRDAIRIARSRHFDAILMDMQLPEIDGCDATRAIRSGEPADSRTPIIAMTANAHAEDRRLCLEAGMDDYLSKPLRQEALQTTLLRWITKDRPPA